MRSQNGAAVGDIYLKGSTWAKSAFYDGFTALRPNLFGTRDEGAPVDDRVWAEAAVIHRIRRRQTAHAFSQASVLDMEPLINTHLSALRKWVDDVADTGKVLDLKARRTAA